MAINLSWHNTAYALQGVHQVGDFVPRPMPAGKKPVNRMVFIGKDLDEARLKQGFMSCLVQ